MPKLRKLQEQYLKGEINKATYEAEVAKLLADEIIDQEQHDDALEYNPEDEKPKFTQAEVDAMIVAKAAKMVRSELKKAGIEGLDGVGNKELLPKVAELLKGKKDDGQQKNDPEADKLKGKYEKAVADNKDLRIENAVLKTVGKYNPINAAQVVRALRDDYLDLVEVDDEGVVNTRTVDTALKKIYAAEPNLFQKEGDDSNGGQGQGGGFQGKGPGGGAGGNNDKDKLAAKKAEALEMLGIKPNTNK